ncbi:NBR1-Ig-like domain-containing protein [Pseudoduganella violaceinigra]|uniref:NBR1-Ig-like domain-containing protein n=1 Tax=Pseudoduganella violaceinigra TaxID=246602 RepID=UPI000417650E|nr:NBR1-Ig-like domain-containing protein [Pseudoduganella violaceinigra]
MSGQKKFAGRWRLFALWLCFAALNLGAIGGAQAGKPGTVRPAIATPPDPEDQTPDAAPFNIWVPTTLFVGQTFTPKISFRNMGNPVWTGYSYHVGSLYDYWGQPRLDFGGTIRFNDVLALQPTLVAPTTPGTYPFAWQMMYDGGGFFGSTTQVYMINVVVPKNDAALGAVSAPPLLMRPGEARLVSVTLTNTGNTTWSAADGYQLGFVGDAMTWGGHRVPLPSSVAPNGAATFSFYITAPAMSGIYTAQWGMLRESVEWFGQQTGVYSIKVQPPQPPQISVSRTPSTMQANQSFTLNWSTSNATSLSRVCTANGTGFTSNDSMALSGASSGTASAAWVGYPSTCIWSASGPGGTSTATEMMATAGYGAEFVIQSVPSTMIAGQTYQVSVTMKNTGALAWSAANNAQLGTTGPANNITWGLNRVPLSGVVLPGQNAQFVAIVKAPVAAGAYNLQWQMTEPVSGAFGNPSANVRVDVLAAAAGAPTLNVSHAPTTLTSGENYTVTWSSTNATRVTMQCSDANYSVVLRNAGQFSAIAKPEWAGAPAVCTWTAAGPAGSVTLQDTMTTQAAPAYCN